MNIKTSLRMAVALVVGTAMQGALAASPTDPIKIASEEQDFSTATSITGGLTFDIPVMGSKMISSTAPYFVVITLKNGATFGSGSATLTCGYSAVATVTAATDSPAAADGGAVAAFKLESAGTTNGLLTASKCTLTLTANAFKLASGKKDYGISVVSRHLDPSDSVSATVSGTLVTFVQGLQLSVTAGKVTVDVTSPSLSKKFQDGGSVAAGGLLLTASLGALKYGAVEGVMTLSGTLISADVESAIGKYVSSVTILVSGSPLAAVQTTAITPTGAAPIAGANKAGLFVGNQDDCTDETSGGALINASGVQASFTIPAAWIASGDGVMNVCMLANGTSTIDRGTVSFAVTVAASGSYKPNVGIVDTTLVKIVKNGTSIKVLNIPAPQNGTDQAYVRFYNMSSNSGKVFGTLYAQDGTALGTANTLLIDNFAANNVKALSSTDLATAFGLSTAATAQAWAGRAWLQIESEVKGLRVQALVRSGGAGGVLMNMSDKVLGDDETTTHR